MSSKGKDKEAEAIAEQKPETMSSGRQNVTKPTLTVDQTEQIPDLEEVLDVLVDYGKVTMHLFDQGKLVTKDDKFTEVSITEGNGPQLPFDDLRPQDRIEFSDLASNPNSVKFGKYLVCQTISLASEVSAVVAIITDPKGDFAMPLALYNYTFRENSEVEVNGDDILPPGSFLVVKNPSFKPHGVLILNSDNPAEVELVSRKRLEAKFPDLGWKGEIAEKTLQYCKKRCFWSDIEGDEAAFLKLKRLGDKGLVEKRFSDAIRFYNMALDYCNENGENEATILSNKSEALVALGCFNAALKCTQFPLDVDPGNEKHIYRKTKALIGLGKYEEALSFLEEKFNQFLSLSKSKDCKTLLDDVTILFFRKNSGLSKSQLLSIYKKTLDDADDIAEFRGPLAETSEIEGKDRGIVATDDIRPGQLLFCAKAFAYQATPPGHNHGNDSDCKKPLQDQIVKKIANKLLFDPELRPEFYNLRAGAELGHLEPGDPKIDYIDMARIAGIVKIHTFDSEKKSAKTDVQTETTGLWIVPSLLNHSCSENNTEWHISGEVLTLTAIAEIKKGEELTIQYISPIANYETRQDFFKNHDLSCNCKLCQLDASESISVRNERQEILKSLGQLTPKFCPGEMRKALEAVKRLVSLRKNNVSLNFPLLSSQVVQLGEILFAKDRHGDCISLLNRLFDVANASVCWHFEGIIIAGNLISCYALKWNRKMTKEWMATVKRLLMKFYGHLEFFREFGDTAVELLRNRCGIDFFQEDDDEEDSEDD